jgi:hypothetical protein
MQLFDRLTATINRYLTLIGDQQIIDQRLKQLFEMEKQIVIKNVLLGDASLLELSGLSKVEQIKLLRSLVIQKVANNESAEEAIAALALIENTPPHAIKHDHLYNIPILLEVGDILRMATVAGLLIGGVSLVTLAVNPRFCGEQNNSQFCNQVNATYRYFYNPKEQ